MNIDITYCSQTNCKHTNCFRHQKHIPEYFTYVSIGNFPNCEYWKEYKIND